MTCLLMRAFLIKLQVDFLFNESNSNFFCNLDEMSWRGEIEIKISANWRNALVGRNQLISEF
jgi:hypothetical protein